MLPVISGWKRQANANLPGWSKVMVTVSPGPMMPVSNPEPVAE